MPNPAPGALPEIDNDEESLRCRHIDALGRRCRMFVAAPEEITSGDHPDALEAPTVELCPHHSQRLLRRRHATEATAAELLASVTGFTDAASVNRFLGNLIKLVAFKRIPRRDALALAYISQLILNSHAAQDRRELMRLQIANLDAERQKNLPFRVIWDLPLRPKAQAQEVNPGNPGPSEAAQPARVPAAPAAASASAQSQDHESEQLTTQTPPPPPDRPESSGVGVPPAASGPPKPLPGFTLTREGHTTDWYPPAPPSWSKPKPSPRAFPRRNRWHRATFAIGDESHRRA